MLSGFGPVHADGYGVSYQLPQHALRFCVSAYKPHSAKAFAHELCSALRLVERLLQTEAPLPSRARL